MRLRRSDWPKVIGDIYDACISAAKSRNVHGRSSVAMDRVGDESFYVITLRVPAGETVGARAMKPPSK